MRPVIKRISETAWDGLGPFLELFIVACIAGDLFFGDSVCSQGPPFIVVAVQPGLRKVVELMVRGDQFGGKMAVIVVNGHFRRVLVVESPRRLGLEKKIFGNKLVHSRPRFLSAFFWADNPDILTRTSIVALGVVVFGGRFALWRLECCHFLSPV